MKKSTISEHKEQRYLFDWAEKQAFAYPLLRMMYAIPNGSLRTKKGAAILKAEGVKSGVPDVCLPVANRFYHGLYIEMKRSDGGDGGSDNQWKWIDQLNAQGYMAVVCHGWDEARKAILHYLKDRQV